MALPLIGAGVTAGATVGRGLLAYLAKKRAMQAAQKSALSQIGRYGSTVPNAAKFVVNPSSSVGRFAKRMGIGGLAAGSFLAGDEYGKRHPRVEAMEDLGGINGRIPNPYAVNKGDAEPAFVNPFYFPIGSDARREAIENMTEADHRKLADMNRERLRMDSRAFIHPEEMVQEDGRILNPLYGDNYYEGTGAQDLRYIPKYLTKEGEVNTFMGIPKRKSPRRR